ncbi:MAG: hypothetical protein IKN63_05695 [Bacilli bacterium]|nr:hypothetical protein [Bacilli bacterium]
MNDIINEIIEISKRIQLLQEDIIRGLDNEINIIIEKRIVDDNRVSYLFDKITNLFPCNQVESLLKKLSHYYYNINYNLVMFYIDTYLDMHYDKEDIQKLKILY